jgi:hypothetical protein
MNELQKAQSGSTHLSTERIEHRTWIKGRATTLLSHYWREDDDPALLAAIGKDWADVLEGIPQEYIQRACVQYQREEPRRKPTPGAIYALARDIMPKPRTADELRPMSKQEAEAYLQSVSREKINPERKAAADAVLKRAGIKLGWPE